MPVSKSNGDTITRIAPKQSKTIGSLMQKLLEPNSHARGGAAAELVDLAAKNKEALTAAIVEEINARDARSLPHAVWVAGEARLTGTGAALIGLLDDDLYFEKHKPLLALAKFGPEAEPYLKTVSEYL